MRYPQVPITIRPELDSLRVSAAAAFQRGDWETAARRMDETYNFLLEQQRHYETRFHKGWELYNGGLAHIKLEQFDEGVKKIFLAYAEDALSADMGQEDAIDELPAGVLFGGAAERGEFVAPIAAAIKTVARQRKEEGQIPHDPEELFKAALRPVVTGYEQAQAPIVEEARREEAAEKRTIESLTQPWDRCCFVGGNYYAGGPNLEPIMQIVRDEGFEPVMPLRFEFPQTDVHHRSLLLLHLCRKAVFEVTLPAGQLMELERCRDYDIEPLLVRNVLHDQDAHVSQMISTMANVKVDGYTNLDELRSLIRDYLRR